MTTLGKISEEEAERLNGLEQLDVHAVSIVTDPDGQMAVMLETDSEQVLFLDEEDIGMIVAHALAKYDEEAAAAAGESEEVLAAIKEAADAPIN